MWPVTIHNRFTACWWESTPTRLRCPRSHGIAIRRAPTDHRPRPLDGGEHVLPVAWDGEFYLPLGRTRPGPGGSTEIVLEQLVPPIATARDLRGSIRILFRKVIGQRLGLGYDYPLLTGATVADDGTVAYERDGDAILTAISSADRILLYVHGIIPARPPERGRRLRILAGNPRTDVSRAFATGLAPGSSSGSRSNRQTPMTAAPADPPPAG
jgi:hypothetical protein